MSRKWTQRNFFPFSPNQLHQSQILVGKPFLSMKFPQRGQRPGSLQISTKWFGFTGHVGWNFCQTKFRRAEPSRKITGGISGRKKPGNLFFPSAPARRRNLVKTSINSRQSRHTTVCTSQ